MVALAQGIWWRSLPSAPTVYGLSIAPFCDTTKARRKLSGAQVVVARDSPVAIFAGLLPSMFAVQTSVRSRAGWLTYITRFPSGEMEGCVAFSDAMSLVCLVRIL